MLPKPKGFCRPFFLVSSFFFANWRSVGFLFVFCLTALEPVCHLTTELPNLVTYAEVWLRNVKFNNWLKWVRVIFNMLYDILSKLLWKYYYSVHFITWNCISCRILSWGGKYLKSSAENSDCGRNHIGVVPTVNKRSDNVKHFLPISSFLWLGIYECFKTCHWSAMYCPLELLKYWKPLVEIHGTFFVAM